MKLSALSILNCLTSFSGAPLGWKTKIQFKIELPEAQKVTSRLSILLYTHSNIQYIYINYNNIEHNLYLYINLLCVCILFYIRIYLHKRHRDSTTSMSSPWNRERKKRMGNRIKENGFIQIFRMSWGWKICHLSAYICFVSLVSLPFFFSTTVSAILRTGHLKWATVHSIGWTHLYRYIHVYILIYTQYIWDHGSRKVS